MIDELRPLKEILDSYNRAITNITVRVKAELAIGNKTISCEELIIELQKAYNDINKTFGKSIDRMRTNIEKKCKFCHSEQNEHPVYHESQSDNMDEPILYCQYFLE